MPRDPAVDRQADAKDREGEEALFCVRCGTLVTRGRWRIRMNGAHEHVVFNPAGVVFRLFCFSEAPGLAPLGTPSTAFTWFKGFAWRVGVCRDCRAHLGWRYDGAGSFFGIIGEAVRRGPAPD